MDSFNYKPIGYFYCDKQNPYEAARQATASHSDEEGIVELLPHFNFEQSLEGLDQFTHAWLIYEFHHNHHWNPKVLPPRGPNKVGVFATRSPYRPNPIGISCVQIKKIIDKKIYVTNFDLLNNTPILDIKPYLSYSDSFTDAGLGWLKNIETEKFSIQFNDLSKQQLLWLIEQGLTQIEHFIIQQLEFDPLDDRKKRVSISHLSQKHAHQNMYEIAYRTWRVEFTIDSDKKLIKVLNIKSNYSLEELSVENDPYKDKELHKRYRATFIN